MRYRPCDELGSDLSIAQTQWGVNLDYVLCERLIEYVTEHYRSGTDFESLLETSLTIEMVADETERHAYKCALGLFFNRRAQHARQQTKARDEVPFAPR